MITIEHLESVRSDAELQQIKQLYLSNGWIEAQDDQTEELIRKIVSHTFCFAIARENGDIVGMGRSISDGVSDAYIQDVTVRKDYRKRGIGGKIIGFLVDYLHKNGIGWVGLISEPGYENFYRELGFTVMQSYTPFLYTAPKEENQDKK